MKKKATSPNKFIHIITTPFRALGKARDFYVRSMMSCANRNVIGLQGSFAPGLPRSFSTSTARSSEPDEDYRELLRAASGRSFGGRMNSEPCRGEEMKKRSGSMGGPRAMPPRSISVAMGRIDEESPCCYFGEDNGNNAVKGKRELRIPRSRSHAVSRTVF